MSTSGGLAPRPQPDGEVLAVLTAAAEQLLRPVAVVVDETPANPWRFSGRWFTKHHITRRDRP